jgi:hypothetical protein
MNTWAPLFSKIVDSSVWCEEDHVRIVWITMLALKDADHVVRYSAFQLAQRAHKSEAEVLDALQVLAAPDTKRLEPQPFEGRRIEKTEDGWKVLNGEAYKELMRSINRKAYKAEHEKGRRAKKKAASGPLPGEQQAQRMEANGASRQSIDDHTTRSLPDQCQETTVPYHINNEFLE